MLLKNERTLIFIIRYLPIISILIVAVIVTGVIDLSNKTFTKNNIQEKVNLFTKFHNEEIKEEVERVYKYIHNEKENSTLALKQYIKARVYEAHAVATKIYEDNKDIKSKKEILELIKTALGSIIYNKGRGYYFIDSAEGISILQPLNKELENKNKLEFRDANGYQFVKTIVETIKNKSERYDSYYWYKPGNKEKSYEKISFYKYFEPLNFAIGTGDYIDDFISEMKERIIKNIQKIKLKNENHIFLLDFDGNILAHPYKEQIGKNFANIKSDKKFKSIREMIKIAKKDSGFLSYYYSSLDNKEHKKTSYIKGVKDWQWVIGTGYYDRDLNEIIKDAKKSLEDKYNSDYKTILIISVIATLILLMISLLISKKIERKFINYRNRIRTEEKEFKNLFQLSDIGLAISDTSGKFIRVNKKFVDILGYSSEEDFLDKSWDDISHNEFTKEERKVFNDLKNKKIDKYSIEKVYVKEDGTVFDAYLTVNSFNAEGELKYTLSSLVDLTDIKRKDELLFQQSKMASMGEMLANIAHQWRQPLSIISTASSGIKMHKEYGSLDDEKLIDSVDTITSTTQYLSSTIDDFRDFFNPNKVKRYITSEEIISRALNLTISEFKNRDIKVIQNTENIELRTLRNEMIQVLINILNNAKDALKNNDDEKLIYITCVEENKNLVISINDNAGGIPTNIIDRVFEPYFTTKHKSQGTGIGLYMVSEIIKKHMNGKIKVENEKFLYKNKEYYGAKFTIFIPLHIEENN